MDTWAASKSWLLLIVLQWAQGYLCSFKLVFQVSSDKFPEVESLGHKAVPFLIFWDNSMLFFPQWLHQSAFLPIVQKGSPFSTSSPALVVYWFIDGHSDLCEVISHCGFNLHLSDDWWHWAYFHMSIGHLCVLFEEVSIEVLCPFFNRIVWFSLVLSFKALFNVSTCLYSPLSVHHLGQIKIKKIG